MLTDCPHCHKQYRLLAKQVVAAVKVGKVQCSHCQTVYDLLDRLYDEQPRRMLAALVRKSLAKKPVAQSASTDLGGPLGNIPVWLALEAAPVRENWGKSVVFGGFLCLLVVALLTQLAWFQRDRVLIHYPQIMPYAKALCVQFNCALVRHQDLGAIKLVNRDVRWHPNIAQAMLVNATLLNQAEQIQPFPRIRLVLLDVEGTVTAHRIFLPHEYLDDSIDTALGMAPGVFIQVVLELQRPTSEAVGFEFDFL